MKLSSEKPKLSTEHKLELAREHELMQADMVNRLALMQCNAVTGSDEDFAAMYGMTLDAVAKFRKERKKEIDNVVDEHKYGKFLVTKSIGTILSLKEVWTRAKINGDDEIAEKIRKILVQSESIVPIKTLKDIAQIYSIMNDEPTKSVTNNIVNVTNTNPSLEAAQRDLENRRMSDAIDVTPEGGAK